MKNRKWQSWIFTVPIVLLIGCSQPLIHEDVSRAYSKRAQTKFIINQDYAGAIEDFTLAIEFNYKDAYSYLGRGMAYQKQGNSAAAKKDFKKAVSLSPKLLPLVQEDIQ